jgi:hypothetical protein
VQYDGLEHTDDEHDAFWLAHLMRLGILPTGYIYPKSERGLRDLARQRMRLVQHRTSHITSVQSQFWRSTAVRLRSETIKGKGKQPWPELLDPDVAGGSREPGLGLSLDNEFASRFDPDG